MVIIESYPFIIYFVEHHNRTGSGVVYQPPDVVNRGIQWSLCGDVRILTYVTLQHDIPMWHVLTMHHKLIFRSIDHFNGLCSLK